MNNHESASENYQRLLAYESGQLSGSEIVELFQELIDDGRVWSLQGSYGRMAKHLIETGHCLLAPVTQKDFFDNPIPSRFDVELGSPGSTEFAATNRSE